MTIVGLTTTGDMNGTAIVLRKDVRHNTAIVRYDSGIEGAIGAEEQITAFE